MRTKKGVVLITVIIVTLLVAILAAIVIYVMTQQAYIAENKIRRSRGYYAAMAAVSEIHALLRNNQPLPAGNVITIGNKSDGSPYPLRVKVDITNSVKWPGLKEIKAKVIY